MTNRESGNIARVIELHGQRAKLYIDDGVVEAVSRGKVKYGSSGVSPIAVGDYVFYSRQKNEIAAIEKIRERNKVISRPAVQREGYDQVLVSNIDRFIIVTSIAEPGFKPGLVDRFLVIAFKEEIHPVIVVNKIDLGDISTVREHIDAWRKISCDVIATSAKTGEGIDSLIDIIHEGTSVVAGHSGVGKSSLINRINPELKLKTKELSAYSKRGVHTTTSARLYRLFPNGWVADTPGLKDFGLSGIDKKSLHYYFPEFAPLEPHCQFGNCVHINEPNCAVKDAIKGPEPSVAAFRYKNYLNIYNSLK